MRYRQDLRTALNRNVLLLALTSLCADISTEMIYPILPIFLTTVLAAPASVVGVVEGIAEGIQYGVQGIAGSLADRMQRKKPIALAGYALTALGKPIIGIAPVWPIALLGRAVDRFGSGTRSAPRDALIAASVDATHRGLAFGLEGIGDNAGAFFGPLVALLLVSALHVRLRLVFFLALIPGLLALALVALVHEGKTAPADSRAHRPHSLREAPPTYWRYLIVTGLFGIGNSTNAFLILRLKDIGASFALTLLVYAFFNLIAALVSAPAGALADSVDRKGTLLASFGVFLLAYLGFALGTNVLLLAFLFVGYGVYQGAYRAVGKTYAADLVPDPLRASGIGWYSTVIGLTGFVASSVGGWLWTNISPAATFLYGAAFALIAGIALLFLVPYSLQATDPRATGRR